MVFGLVVVRLVRHTPLVHRRAALARKPHAKQVGADVCSNLSGPSMTILLRSTGSAGNMSRVIACGAALKNWWTSLTMARLATRLCMQQSTRAQPRPGACLQTHTGNGICLQCSRSCADKEWSKPAQLIAVHVGQSRKSGCPRWHQ